MPLDAIRRSGGAHAGRRQRLRFGRSLAYTYGGSVSCAYDNRDLAAWLLSATAASAAAAAATPKAPPAAVAFVDAPTASTAPSMTTSTKPLTFNPWIHLLTSFPSNSS